MIDDLILTLAVGGLYVAGSVVLSIVAVKLWLDWQERRHEG